uniref:Jingzhaotoxin F5-21.66 n=1 Tax=Chilobrachys guangxiensis TaxID=278060 RepID=JZ521_CHIGU|nr:RecName: Full=Jingzhaotoxin F5-21.66; AltName: Full=Peptide F5-21.66 [Chilobrachys guangxiensis]
ECKKLFGGCTTSSECCAHLGCKQKWPFYCAWDWSF